MTEEIFTDPDDDYDDWVDVRMTDPDKGEWDVDVVVVGNQVEYVDLRIRPELLTDFFTCLVDDLGTEQAKTLLTRLADRTDTDLHERTE